MVWLIASKKLTSLSDCMTNAQVACASIRLAKVGIKNRHEKTPHPVTGRGLVRIPNELVVAY